MNDHTEATKTSGDVEIQKEQSHEAGTELQLDEKVVKSLKRKADFILIPVLAIGYLMK